MLHGFIPLVTGQSPKGGFHGSAYRKLTPLGSYLPTAPQGSETQTVAAVELGNELKAAEQSLRAVSQQLYQDRAVLDAIDRVFLDARE